MRPERLELEGFTAFRARQVVDFTDVDLCAFSGPTGAGKSSLIDAIIFALYGSVPRYDDRRAVAPVISQGRTEARVRLDFSAAGQRYSAVRIVRLLPSGGATTKEARLVWHRPDGTEEVVAGTADEVGVMVERILGLTYEHFTTCVVLPQGAFARFLHHKPKDRQSLLVELLDLGLYDRMQSLARERAAAAKSTKDGALRALGDLHDATASRRVELAGRVVALDDLVARLDAEQEPLALLRSAEERAVAAATDARHLAGLVKQVMMPADVASLSESVANAESGAMTARADVSRSEALDDEARTLLAALPPEATLRAALDAHDQLAKQRRRVAQGEEALVGAESALTVAETLASVADVALRAADAALDAARRADLTAALVATLVVGDPCPVCGTTVTADHLDRPGEGRALAAAQRQRADAYERSQAAEKAVFQAREERARIAEKLAGVREAVEELTQRVVAGEPVEVLHEQLARLGVATAAATQARAAVESTRQRARQADLVLERARQAISTARAAFDRARDVVAPLGPPVAARADLALDWAALVDWAHAQAPVLGAREEQARHEAVEARRQRTERLDALVAGAAALDVLVRSPETVRDQVIASRAAAAGALERLDADMARAATLRSQVEQAGEHEVVAGALGRHLQANGFQKWVLDEALERLVLGATGILQRLSGGGYSLTLDAKTSNFAVVDHTNADAVRSARTLSGGETFLASLSLALSLADQVVELAGAAAAPLESIFLDEGFGTLDPDTLDIVASAIEELGSQGRMVGVVSHVRDLAERLPVRFEVRKGPAGATVDRVMA